jgi:RNA polymerase sigma-70 factor, ECF subfamily
VVNAASASPAPLLEEADLIAACIRGDERAQRQLFRREYPRVKSTVYRLVGAGRDVDDLIQETFISVFRSLARFRGEAKLSTWIDRIAVRQVFHHIRSRKQRVSMDSVEEPATGGNVADHMQAREGLRRLYAALDMMTPEARTAFALYAIDGRSIANAAEVSGTSVVATKLRIWRARRQLLRYAATDPVLSELIESGGEEIQ